MKVRVLEFVNGLLGKLGNELFKGACFFFPFRFSGALEENARTMGKRGSMEAGVFGLTITLHAQVHAAGVFNTKRELAQILRK